MGSGLFTSYSGSKPSDWRQGQGREALRLVNLASLNSLTGYQEKEHLPSLFPSNQWNKLKYNMALSSFNRCCQDCPLPPFLSGPLTSPPTLGICISLLEGFLCLQQHSLPVHTVDWTCQGIEDPWEQPTTSNWWKWVWINSPVPHPAGGRTLTLLHHLPEFSSGNKPQFPNVIACLLTHPVLVAFPSLSHFPIFPLVFPWALLQVNDLPCSLISIFASRGTQPKIVY